MPTELALFFILKTQYKYYVLNTGSADAATDYPLPFPFVK